MVPVIVDVLLVHSEMGSAPLRCNGSAPSRVTDDDASVKDSAVGLIWAAAGAALNILG